MSSPSTTLGKACLGKASINYFFGHAPAWYKQAILVQGVVALLLVVSLAFHLVAPGLVGLMISVLQTASNGITEEHQIGEAFHEAPPFTALLVIFCAIVALIHGQHLFTPVVEFVSTFDPEIRPVLFFLAKGQAAVSAQVVTDFALHRCADDCGLRLRITVWRIEVCRAFSRREAGGQCCQLMTSMSTSS